MYSNCTRALTFKNVTGITIFRVVTGQQPSGTGGVTLKTAIEKALRRESPDAIGKSVEKLCDPVAQWCMRTCLRHAFSKVLSAVNLFTNVTRALTFENVQFFLARLLKLGLRCVANLPDERPSIEKVLDELQAMRDPDAPDPGNKFSKVIT